MNAAQHPASLPLTLPWELAQDEDRRFRLMLLLALLLVTVLSMVIPMVSLPALPEASIVDEESTLARLLLEPQALPEPEREEPPPPEPEPVVEPEPVPVEEAVAPAPVPDPREVAAVTGVMALQDDLLAMRETLDVDSLAGASLSRGQESAVAVERAVITAGAAPGSGGIQSQSLSRNSSGSALSAREATRVRSKIADDTAAQRTDRSGSNVAGGSAATGGRSDDSIRRVMDSNKGAVFAIYHRALRRDPTLEGKLVFEMVIDPAGSVVSLVLLSSELTDDALTQRILTRIRSIRFGAEAVRQTRVNYSFDFLPYG